MIPNEICRPGEIGERSSWQSDCVLLLPNFVMSLLHLLDTLEVESFTTGHSKQSKWLSKYRLNLSRARIIGHNWQMNEKRVQRGPSHQCTATTNKRRRPNAINRRGWRGGIDWPAGRLASDWFGCSDGRQVSDHWRLISTRLSGSAPRRQRQK